MSVFGFGFGGQFDDNLDNKINEVLSGTKSLADRNASFLKDLGVKPENLPMPEQDARKFFAATGENTYPHELFALIGAQLPDLEEDNTTIAVHGSSLGLTEVLVTGHNYDGDDVSYCFHDGDPGWPQIERAWKTIKNTELGPRFTIAYDASETYAWKASADPLPLVDWSEVTDGQVLRLADATDPATDIYVSVWQLNPLVCVNLATMQPVEHAGPGGPWVIVEAIGG